MQKLLILLVAFLLVAPAVQAQDKVFNAETFSLANGMQVIVIPNHRAPVVTHMVWFKVGAADEPAGYSGIAHFLEHLMFKGTEKMAPGEFSRTVKTLGGNDNAFTAQDYTAYYQTIAKEHLGTVMEMEADRILHLAPPAEEVASEHKVILEERRQRTDNDPRAMFGEQMRAALYVNHPYGTPVIGWMHEMEDLNWEIADEFHRQWYSPANAILIVSGDITAEELRPMAERIYGSLPPAGVPERMRTQVPTLGGERRIVFRHPDIRQPYFERIMLVPSYRQSKDEALSLQLLEEAISGGPTTRLYKTLAVEQKVASSAGLYYRADAWDDGEIGLYATPVAGVTLEQLEQAFEEELRLIATGGITKDELELAKTRLKAEAVYARDSLAGPAMVVGRALTTGATLDDVERWPQLIDAVTLEQVNSVAAKYLDPDRRDAPAQVTGYLLPVEEAALTEQQPGLLEAAE